MQQLKYPTIAYIQKAIASQISPLLESESCQIQIKYGKLMVAQTNQYRSLKQQSANKIVVLNDRLSFNTCKMYKIHSMTSRKQVENVEKNCTKLSKSHHKTSMIDLKFGREKLQKIVGQQNWYFSYKKSLLSKNKQINYLANRAEFRLDLSQQQYQQNGDNKISQFGQSLPSKIRCLRFKRQSKYDVSPFFRVKIVKVYQIEDNIEKIGKQLYQAYKTQENQKIDQFIMRYVPQPSSKEKGVKEEIELNFTPIGVKKIMGLLKNSYELNKFVGDVIYDFRNLSDDKCSQLRSKDLTKLQIQLEEKDNGENSDEQAQKVILKLSTLKLDSKKQ